jgi:hypothetical protein
MSLELANAYESILPTLISLTANSALRRGVRRFCLIFTTFFKMLSDRPTA